MFLPWDMGESSMCSMSLKRRASLLSSFLIIENSLCFGVSEIISFQKFMRKLDKMAVANLGRQHERSLDSYFKSSSEYLY